MEVSKHEESNGFIVYIIKISYVNKLAMDCEDL